MNIRDIEILKFFYDNELDEVYQDESVTYLKKDDNFQSFKKGKDNVMLSSKEVVKISTSEAIDILVKRNSLVAAKIDNNIVNNLASNSMTSSIMSISSDFSINKIIENAKILAKKATNLQELKEIVENFDGCNLKKMATNTVFGEGNYNTKILVIGEAPGNHEDLSGVPFCGDSGKLLNEIFGSINLSRKDIFITNAIFWRPPGNRKPTNEELAICRPFTERQIEILKPKLIIFIGATSFCAITKLANPISEIRGRVMEYKFDFIPETSNIFTIFHPSYLLRQPSKKKIMWEDMLELKAILKKFS